MIRILLTFFLMATIANNIINTCTLNVNGLLDNYCQYSLKCFCLQNNIDILFLQETHVSNLKKVNELNDYFDMYKCFWNFGTNFSRGTAIFISHSLDFKINKFHRDLEGRFQYIDVDIDCIPYRLLNIYAPTNECERKEFFEDVYPFILTKDCKIFGGDFNCIINSKLDKKGGNFDRGFVGTNQLKDIIYDFELFDVFRYIEPNLNSYTWHSKNIACRLDRIYLSNCLKSFVRNCRHIPFAFSDHDGVFVSFINNINVKTGQGYWKLNSSVLKDKCFVDSFREWFTNFSDNLDICNDIWDYFKENIKTFCIDYCKRKNRVKYRVIKELEKKYFMLCKEEKMSPGNYFEQIFELKKQIKQFHLNNFKGSQIRSKVKVLNNSETPNKYFFQTETKKSKKKSITEIRKDDVVYKDNDNIMKQFINFYDDLFKAEDIDENVMDFFLKDLPMLEDLDKNVCDEPIVLNEIIDSIKDMDNDKSPGPDGLSKEFYMTFIDIFAPMLLKLYENICNEKTLSNSQKISYITLICKDPEKHYDVTNYRPISLINIDVKILSKLICKRMSLVCDNIIGIDQTCAIRGRSILDNGHLHRNIIDYCNQKNLKCAFISLDQEKAFDRISHTFLFNVLEKYNFGPNLINWIKILYTDLNSSIIINNFISEPVNISRSVKQGCSLSPLLYILCLEPFIRKVCLDREIKGIQLPGSNISCKISAFADDSTGIMTDDYSINKFLYWINLFGKASGSKLNKNKTKGIWLGAWKDRKDNYKFGIDFVNSLKGYCLPAA